MASKYGSFSYFQLVTSIGANAWEPWYEGTVSGYPTTYYRHVIDPNLQMCILSDYSSALGRDIGRVMYLRYVPQSMFTIVNALVRVDAWPFVNVRNIFGAFLSTGNYPNINTGFSYLDTNFVRASNITNAPLSTELNLSGLNLQYTNTSWQVNVNVTQHYMNRPFTTAETPSGWTEQTVLKWTYIGHSQNNRDLTSGGISSTDPQAPTFMRNVGIYSNTAPRLGVPTIVAIPSFEESVTVTPPEPYVTADANTDTDKMSYKIRALPPQPYTGVTEFPQHLPRQKIIIPPIRGTIVNGIRAGEQNLYTWGLEVYDDNENLVFSSLDTPWNQVDYFTVPANGSVSKNYPSIAGREYKVTQVMIDAPVDLESETIKHTINATASGYVTVSGGNVTAFCAVLVR